MSWHGGERDIFLKLSVVIPVFNEAAGLVRLLDEVAAVLAARSDTEIVVVDDASTDDTLQLIQHWRSAHPEPVLRAFRHLANAGQSAAIATGVQQARGEWIATLDGDGQNDPADIPLLEQKLQAETDNSLLIICGHRTQRNDNTVKRLASRVANAIRAAILRDNTPDTGCGLKLFPRALFLELPYFDHMHRFLPALVSQRGGRAISVPVRHRARAHGQSNYGVFDRLWAGIIDLGGVLWLGARRRPVQVEKVED